MWKDSSERCKENLQEGVAVSVAVGVAVNVHLSGFRTGSEPVLRVFAPTTVEASASEDTSDALREASARPTNTWKWRIRR